MDSSCVPDDPVVVNVLIVIAYSAPGCRSEIMILFCVQGTVIIPPSRPFWEPIMMLYVMV